MSPTAWSQRLLRERRPQKGRPARRGPHIDTAGRLVGLTDLIGAPGHRHVVLLAHPALRQAVNGWLNHFPGDSVSVLALDEAAEWDVNLPHVAFEQVESLHQIERELMSLPRVDIIVDLIPDGLVPDTQYSLFSRVFRFIEPGGTFILDREVAPTTSRELGSERWLELLAAVEEREQNGEPLQKDHELARSAGTVVLTPDLIVITKRLRHHLMLSERDLERFLQVREPGLSVSTLDRRGAGTLSGPPSVRIHGIPPDAAPWEEEMPYPAVSLRHYRGDVVSSGSSLLWASRTVLPDSFRWHLSAKRNNPLLVNADRNFCRIQSRHYPDERLEGDFYLLDSTYSGHFGHLTTEVVSRLWGWHRAKQELPGLKALIHTKRRSSKDPRLERQLFAAYGIDPSDLLWVNHPVSLTSVVSASPMWHMEDPHFAHGGIREVWSRITSGFLEQAPPSRGPERLFVSRSDAITNRRCRNTEEVEALFAQRGFEVIYPEKLGLSAQVQLFSGARVVAGFAGSAMFNVMHCHSLDTMVVLSQNSYTARNEHLFASLLGARLEYFYSAADIPHPQGRRTKEAFRSDWEFDFDLHGAALDHLLREL